MSAAYYPQVQKIYVAYYGRPADPAGLQYWAGQLAANGGSLTAIINAFGNSAESTALYAGADNAAKVTAIYQQLFNRSPDSAGLAFYVNELSLGRMTAASIALNVANGATGTDATYLTNKQAVASSFTDSLTTDSAAAVAYSGTAAANTARALISGVTTSAATTNVASTIAAIKPGGGAAATGQTFTLTIGQDIISGTSRNDVITAPKNTFTAATGAADLIVDSSTSDNDTLNITYDATDITSNPNVSVMNIENVNVNFDAIGAGTYNAASTTGATITVSSTRATYSGSATVTSAGANNVIAGKGVTGTLTANALTSGYVDAGSATTVTLGNAANTATSLGYDVRVNGNITLNPEFTGATTDRSLGLTASKDATVTLGTITGGGANVTQVLGAGSGKITLKGDVAEFSATPTITGIDTVQLMTATAAFDLKNVASSVKLTSALDQSYTNVAGESISATGANTLTLSAATANSSTGTVNFTKSASTLTEGANAFGSLTVNLTKDVSAFTGPNSLADAMTINVAASTTTIASQTLGAGQTLTLAGTGNVTYTAITTDATANSIDASGISGGLTVTLPDNQITVVGGAGNDKITSSATTTSPTITSGAGNDTVTVSALTTGTATITSGDGNDTVDFVSVAGTTNGKITVSLGAGDDTIKWGSTTIGTTGATISLVIDGGDGNDTLDLGATGNSLGTLALTTGKITLSNLEIMKVTGTATVESSLLSGKSYTVNGGTGTSDYLTVNALAATKSIDLSGLTIGSTLERVVTDVSAQTDAVSIVGSAGIDYITLSGNADTVDGGAGNDSITMDVLGGGATVNGGAGNDTFVFIGNATSTDKITLTGGAGSDTFDLSDFDAGADKNTFTISDFTAGAGGDKIKLTEATGKVFNVTSASYDAADTVSVQDADTAVALGANAAGTGTTSYVIVDTAANILSSKLDAAATGFIAIASDTGAFYFDADGDFTAGAVKLGTITITGTLTSDNFVIA